MQETPHEKQILMTESKQPTGVHAQGERQHHRQYQKNHAGSKSNVI